MLAAPAPISYNPRIREGGLIMKAKIHPEYQDCSVTCACGNVIQTRSTKGDYKVEICSSCHPFFTGKQKLIDSAGRVERFNTRYKKAGKA